MANQKSKLTVGYSRLPGRTSEGSRAYFGKQFTISARESMQSVIENFRLLVAAMKDACPDSLEEAMSPTFDKAQRYCPKKTRALVESGEMISGINANGGAYCQISFGDNGRISYAAIVHERTDLHHALPTRSKYLEAAVSEDLHLMQRRFARAIKKRTGIPGGNV